MILIAPSQSGYSSRWAAAASGRKAALVNPQRSQPYSGTHPVFPPTGATNRSSSVRSWATSRSRPLERRGRSWRSYAGDSPVALRATSANIVSAKSRRRHPAWRSEPTKYHGGGERHKPAKGGDRRGRDGGLEALGQAAHSGGAVGGVSSARRRESWVTGTLRQPGGAVTSSATVSREGRGRRAS